MTQEGERFSARKYIVTSPGPRPQIQTVDGTETNIEMVFTEGFISMPENGREAVIVSCQDSKEHDVMIGVIDPIDYGLEPGDRMMITQGAQIKIKKNGKVIIGAATEVTILSGTTVNISATGGDVNITSNSGNVTVNAPTVYLGGQSGTEKVARRGDPVSVNTFTGIGTITDGSDVVNSQ